MSHHVPEVDPPCGNQLQKRLPDLGIPHCAVDFQLLGDDLRHREIEPFLIAGDTVCLLYTSFGQKFYFLIFLLFLTKHCGAYDRGSSEAKED